MKVGYSELQGPPDIELLTSLRQGQGYTIMRENNDFRTRNSAAKSIQDSSFCELCGPLHFNVSLSV